MADVLVVDDAMDLRLLMRMALQSVGHRVVDADGGVEAMEILERTPELDVVVLDVQMPVVDGWEVLRHLRRHPVHRDVPVMMCTVKFSQEDLVRAFELGCDAYLSKPFDLDDLTSMAEEIISTDADVRARRRADTLRALHLADGADDRLSGAPRT